MSESEAPDLPTLPTKLTVIELTENNAPRTCNVCGDPADYYAFVTDGAARDRLGEDWSDLNEWPVNAMLCSSCFEDAPRVGSLEDHPKVA